jgi:hypothetical protein
MTNVYATLPCPHCGAANPAGSTFCESCGKALPSATPTGPRIITGDVLPSSAAGQKLVGDQLSKQTRRAAYTLLIVGIILAVLGAILAVAVATSPDVTSAMGAAGQDPKLLMAIHFGLAVIFLGLFVWALRSPLPASIVGLVIWGTLVLLNVVNALSNIDVDDSRRGMSRFGVGCMDIVIIAVLAQGIQAALKHKRMLRGQTV